MLEDYSINLVPTDFPNEENAVYKAGLAASTKNNEDEYLIYLEFDLANDVKIKEYLKVEVED